MRSSCAGDGAKAVAKRKLQQGKLGFSKASQEQPAQAEVSGSNEPEAASPVVLPKVSAVTPPREACDLKGTALL